MNLAALLFNKPFVPPQGTVRIISYAQEAEDDQSKYIPPAKVDKKKSVQGGIMNVLSRHDKALFSTIQKETGFTQKSIGKTICHLKKRGLMDSHRISGRREYLFYLTGLGKRWIDEFNALAQADAACGVSPGAIG